MKLGVTLPSFRDDAEVVDAARRAEAAGVDGVFVFDHLWPMGQPERPALACAPTLGAVAAATTTVMVGPLVARVGLVPDEMLVARFRSLGWIAPGRVIATLGTGDAHSAGENRAYGIAYEPADDRRLAVAACARRLRAAGMAVWIGGGSTATTELADQVGAAVNLWEGQPAAVAARAGRGEVTWGGVLRGPVAQMAEWLAELDRAGASWAVVAWPRSLDDLVEAARAVR